jgi:hypothetical protein
MMIAQEGIAVMLLIELVDGSPITKEFVIIIMIIAVI